MVTLEYKKASAGPTADTSKGTFTSAVSANIAEHKNNSIIQEPRQDSKNILSDFKRPARRTGNGVT